MSRLILSTSTYRPACDVCIKQATEKALRAELRGVIATSRHIANYKYAKVQNSGEIITILHGNKCRLSVQYLYIPARTLSIPRPLQNTLLSPKLILNAQQVRRLGVGNALRAWRRFIKWIVLTGAVGSGVAVSKVCARWVLLCCVKTYFVSYTLKACTRRQIHPV